jgi:plastocyanin
VFQKSKPFGALMAPKQVARPKDSWMFNFTAARRMNVSIAAVLALSGALPVTAAAAAGREAVVTMANMNFGQMPSGLKVGDSVVFVNRDSVPHTITARDHSFDLRVGPGQRGRVTLAKAGTIPIYCILHSQMRGTLSVAAK